MRRLPPLILALAAALLAALLAAGPAAGQHMAGQHKAGGPHAGGAMGGSGASLWFGVLEFPFLALCVVLAVSTARALRGGAFGAGMRLLAWGFLVMAVGHLHMQVEHFTGFNLFAWLLGAAGGAVAWYVALVVTWGLSVFGFARILRASRASRVAA